MADGVRFRGSVSPPLPVGRRNVRDLLEKFGLKPDDVRDEEFVRLIRTSDGRLIAVGHDGGVAVPSDLDVDVVVTDAGVRSSLLAHMPDVLGDVTVRLFGDDGERGKRIVRIMARDPDFAAVVGHAFHEGDATFEEIEGFVDAVAGSPRPVTERIRDVVVLAIGPYLDDIDRTRLRDLVARMPRDTAADLVVEAVERGPIEAAFDMIRERPSLLGNRSFDAADQSGPWPRLVMAAVRRGADDVLLHLVQERMHDILRDSDLVRAALTDRGGEDELADLREMLREVGYGIVADILLPPGVRSEV